VNNWISQIISGVFLAIGLIFATWLFFGPVAGFHHMIAFGVTGYLTLNGDGPPPGEHMWGDYAVRFWPGRFAIGFVLWCLSVFAIFRLDRFLSRFVQFLAGKPNDT
jgi:hypothetical protein